MRSSLSACYLVALVSMLATPVFAQPSTAVVWDLTEIYSDEAAWERGMAEAQAEVDGLSALSGTLGASSDSLRNAMSQMSALNKEVARLYVYTTLIDR